MKETIRYCHHETPTYWLITFFIYKSFVLLFGLFIAWKTRDVVDPEHIDAKYSSLGIFNFILFSGLVILVKQVLRKGLETPKIAIETCVILLGSAICQCLIFVPKVRSYFDL